MTLSSNQLPLNTNTANKRRPIRSRFIISILERLHHGDATERQTLHHTGSLGAAMITALGIVYGDIGTSPLYTFRVVLDAAGDTSAATAMGVLSLIAWSLIITISIKYVGFVMRADNNGEGGILALMLCWTARRARRARALSAWACSARRCCMATA